MEKSTRASLNDIAAAMRELSRRLHAGELPLEEYERAVSELEKRRRELCP